jgi:hypothetical protein
MILLCDRSDIAPIRSTVGGGSQGLSRTGTANRLYGGQKATFEGSNPSVSFRDFCHVPPLFMNLLCKRALFWMGCSFTLLNVCQH